MNAFLKIITSRQLNMFKVNSAKKACSRSTRNKNKKKKLKIFKSKEKCPKGKKRRPCSNTRNYSA
jgi:hypothetical protein